MANISISEIVTIAVVILIIFGPHRLPEMAQRAGELLAKFRETAATLKTELSGELEEIAQPFKDIEADLRAAKDDLTGTAKDIQASIPSLDGTVAAPAAAADAEPPTNDVPAKPSSGDQPLGSPDPVPASDPVAAPSASADTGGGSGSAEAHAEPETLKESDVPGDEKA